MLVSIASVKSDYNVDGETIHQDEGIEIATIVVVHRVVVVVVLVESVLGVGSVGNVVGMVIEDFVEGFVVRIVVGVVRRMGQQQKGSFGLVDEY